MLTRWLMHKHNKEDADTQDSYVHQSADLSLGFQAANDEPEEEAKHQANHLLHKGVEIQACHHKHPELCILINVLYSLNASHYQSSNTHAVRRPTPAL